MHKALKLLFLLPLLAAANPTELNVDLVRLGKPRGLVFESSEGEQTLYFSEPRDVHINSRFLVLRYRASTLLKEPSNLRIQIDDVPVHSLALAPGSQTPVEVILPLSVRPNPDSRVVKVNIAVSARITLEKCVDEKLRSGFVHILPESGMHFVTDGTEPPTVLSQADQLGREVVISLSARPLTRDSFGAAWRIASWLWDAKRKVRFVRLPERGDIMIAPSAEIEAAASQPDLSRSQTKVSGNVSVRYLDNRPSLPSPSPFQIGAELLESDWIGVAHGTRYLTRPARESTLPTPDRLVIRLAGLPPDNDILGEKIQRDEWQVRLGPRELPPFYRVHRIELEWISAPRVDGRPQFLHVYRNSELLRSLRLPDDGGPHRQTIDLPKGAAGRDNYFRIVSQRLPHGGECETKYENMPVQLLPGTAFIAGPDKRDPINLDDSSDWLRGGFTLYLSPEYLSQPEKILPFLGQMAASLDLPVDRARITEYSAGKAIQPGPFLLVSATSPVGLMAPVTFERGRVQVLESNGRVLLNSDELPGVAVLQLARAEGSFGIWLRPSADPLPDEGFRPELGDVLFLDRKGLVRALNSTAHDETKIRYPQFTDWVDMLQRYRYQLFAVFWLVLSFGFVQLYRKLSRSKGIA